MSEHWILETFGTKERSNCKYGNEALSIIVNKLTALKKMF